jgi:DNA polymerase III alpha subunit
MNYKLFTRWGFDTYFLIVWDLMPLRPRARYLVQMPWLPSGSIVAHALEITLVESHSLIVCILSDFLIPARIYARYRSWIFVMTGVQK